MLRRRQSPIYSSGDRVESADLDPGAGAVRLYGAGSGCLDRIGSSSSAVQSAPGEPVDAYTTVTGPGCSTVTSEC